MKKNRNGKVEFLLFGLRMGAHLSIFCTRNKNIRQKHPYLFISFNGCPKIYSKDCFFLVIFLLATFYRWTHPCLGQKHRLQVNNFVFGKNIVLR